MVAVVVGVLATCCVIASAQVATTLGGQGSCVMTRSSIGLALLGMLLASGILLVGRDGQAAQPKADHPQPIAQLNLSDPAVSIHGPFPTLMRGARPGDLIVVQVSYPMAPPFPKSAVIVPASRIFSPVGVYRASGKVVTLTPEPQQGGVGVGYLCAVVKAMKAGQGDFAVKVTLMDDSIREVTFTFLIEEEPKRPATNK